MMMVRALAGTLERRGASRAAFIELAQLDASPLDDSDARLSLVAYLRVLDAALQISGDPALGLHMGEDASPVMFDVIGYLAQQATTLRDGIRMIERYAQLAAEGHDPQLVERADAAAIRFPSLRGDMAAVRLTAEFALTGLMSLLRMFIGPHAKPTRVCFAYAAPSYAAEYARVFEGPVQFSAHVTAIEFPRSWLDRTHAYANPTLHALLETRAEELLRRLERDATLTERVSRILAAHAPRQLPTMTAVAELLHMSARSLRRKLQTEATTYAELTLRAQLAAAQRMLRDPRVSIHETAYALGFAAPAAFHRAFKRWTGLTPNGYRAKALDADTLDPAAAWESDPDRP